MIKMTTIEILHTQSCSLSLAIISNISCPQHNSNYQSLPDRVTHYIPQLFISAPATLSLELTTVKSKTTTYINNNKTMDQPIFHVSLR